MVVEIAPGSTDGSLLWPKRYLAEVSVVGQVDQQYQHQNEQDATFHPGLHLWMDMPSLRLMYA
jgi:hypothetical protein